MPGRVAQAGDGRGRRQGPPGATSDLPRPSAMFRRLQWSQGRRCLPQCQFNWESAARQWVGRGGPPRREIGANAGNRRRVTATPLREETEMSKMKAILAMAALSAGLASTGAMAQEIKGPIPYPMPQPVGTTKPILVPYDKLFHYGTLPAYHEPDWVSEFVKAGKLPPVEQRLPKEPLIVDTSMTADGPGSLWRHAAPRDRRAPAGLELDRRPVPGLWRHRALDDDVPGAHRSDVDADPREGRAAAAARQVVGLVGRRQAADHASGRRRQMVGRRTIHLGGRDLLMGRQHRRPAAFPHGPRPAPSAKAPSSRRSTPTRSAGRSRTPSRSPPSTRWRSTISARARPTS